MRITVRHVLELLATYKDREDRFREYPFLEEEDLRLPDPNERGLSEASRDHDRREKLQRLSARPARGYPTDFPGVTAGDFVAWSGWKVPPQPERLPHLPFSYAAVSSYGEREGDCVPVCCIVGGFWRLPVVAVVG